MENKRTENDGDRKTVKVLYGSSFPTVLSFRSGATISIRPPMDVRTDPLQIR